MRAFFVLALALLISGFALCTLYFVFLNIQIPEEPFSSWSELPYAGMFQYAGLVCLLGAIVFLLMEVREARRERPIRNAVNFVAICIVVLANWISFFWGGYHTLLPTLFIFGLLGSSILSAWVAVGMKMKDLASFLLATTLLAFVDEYVHTSVGTLTYFDQAIPSPLTVFGWSLFMMSLLTVTRIMTKIRLIYIKDQIRLRTLPVLASLIFILTVAVQWYISVFNWMLVLVYVVLIVASLYYTYMHSFKWNLLLMATSLVFGFTMEFAGRWEGLWTFRFMEPVSFLILFSWPLRMWTVCAFCFLTDVDLSEKPFRTTLFSSQVMGTGKSIIAVTDTHFGLRDEMFFEPEIFSGFLRWVKRLEGRKVEPLRLGDWEVTKDEKVLQPPQKLIMLGDILELWDASDRSVDVCLRTFTPLLSRLECDKIYVLGNHDDILEEIASNQKHYYPLGDSNLQIIKNTYPEMNVPKVGDDGIENIRALRVGNEEYLFIHGHQFDKHFAEIGPAYRIIAYMREAAMAFGTFTLLFVALFAIGVYLWLLRWSSPSPWMLVLLTLLAWPYISIKFARPVYNAFKSIRYNRLDPARVCEWWNRFSRGKESPLKNLNIVCGHTHLIDVIPSDSPSMRLLNVPSWVKDEGSEKKRENVLRAAFLYVDEEGSAFIGWDWIKSVPFFIPKEVIAKRRGGEALKEKDIERLRAIGWPEELLREWGEPLPVTKLRRTRLEALIQELRR